MKLNAGLCLVVRPSKKDPSRNFIALCFDLGYTLKYLSFDIYFISALLGMPVTDLSSLGVGEYEIEI